MVMVMVIAHFLSLGCDPDHVVVTHGQCDIRPWQRGIVVSSVVSLLPGGR